METVFLVIGSALSLVSIVVVVGALRRGAASRHWRRVPGTVNEVAIERHLKTGGADRFSARVDYKFVFEGSVRRASQGFGRTTIDRDEAVSYGRPYTAGQAVDVFVDPADPRRSTLTPGLNYGHLVTVAFGAVMLVFFLSRLAA